MSKMLTWKMFIKFLLFKIDKNPGKLNTVTNFQPVAWEKDTGLNEAWLTKIRKLSISKYIHAKNT